jgi:hypothetical protein
MQNRDIFLKIEELGKLDTQELKCAEKSYGNSWKKRGGVGAFMMLARKWDRIENQVTKFNYNIFEAIITELHKGENILEPKGILDDIQDLRRYLFLIEAEVHVYLDPSVEAREGSNILTEVALGKRLEGNTAAPEEVV